MKSGILILFSMYILGLTQPAVDAETLPIPMPQNARETQHLNLSPDSNQTLISNSGSTPHHRDQRQCSMDNLSLLEGRINIALGRQIEKMLADDFVDKHPQSPGCIHYSGITMNYPIRLFIRQLVANAVTDYKQDLLRPF